MSRDQTGVTTSSTNTLVSTSPNTNPKGIDELSSSGTQLPERFPIARYDEYFDQRTFSTTLRKTNKPVGLRKVNKKKPVLVVRRIINHKGQHVDTKVDIKSKALCNVLLHINQDVYDLELTESAPIADLPLFFHSRSAVSRRLLEEEKKQPPDPSLIFDLTTTLHFIEEDLSETVSAFERLASLGKITHKLLWALFAPNTLVYRRHPFLEQHQVLICRRLIYKENELQEIYASLMCDTITNSGSTVGLAREYLEIPMFPGTYKIRDLSIYPLDYHVDKEGVYEHAVQRGKRSVGITRQLFNVTGFAFKEIQKPKNSDDDHEPEFAKFHAYGRVMIDPATFRLFQPNNKINLPLYSALEDRHHLKDEEYLICTPVLLGFCFGTKTWGGFALECVSDVVWSDEAFNQLVLSEKPKQLIRALIRQHSMQSETAVFDDIVVGKGKGLVGLLCGNPGCGKTLTAEAAAEITHRPLYVVSAGELGTYSPEVDSRLSEILELTHRWKAVLLLDEAEVFLHKRSTTDLHRNALVSIFLRQLEYYQGILILTTNMVAQFDPAFESRIHFCIKYPDLDFDSRKAVWKTFINKASKNLDSISEDDIDRFAGKIMNGRQIKNAVSIAHCIALDQGSSLLAEHIDTVLGTLNDWETAKDSAVCV